MDGIGFPKGIIMAFFFFWFVFALLVGLFANSRGLSGFLFFVISCIVSPLSGFILVLIAGYGRKCTRCMKGIDKVATICPYCRTEFADNQKSFEKQD